MALPGDKAGTGLDLLRSRVGAKAAPRARSRVAVRVVGYKVKDGSGFLRSLARIQLHAETAAQLVTTDRNRPAVIGLRST